MADFNFLADNEFGDVPDSDENPGGSTQVFGSLVEDDSLAENMSPPYDDSEGEVHSPRRLSASAMLKLSKAARALSYSVGDNGNDTREVNGPIFDIEDIEREELEAATGDTAIVGMRQWTAPSREEPLETATDDYASEPMNVELDSTSEVERRANGVNERGFPPDRLHESTEKSTGVETSEGKDHQLNRQDSISSEHRDFANEDVNDPAWIRHHKHIFLLSEAGKPIYCR
jgi:hypothetical protein